MQTEQEILKDLETLKRKLDLKFCTRMPLSEQLCAHAKIDALHGVLGYHPSWSKDSDENKMAKSWRPEGWVTISLPEDEGWLDDVHLGYDMGYEAGADVMLLAVRKRLGSMTFLLEEE